MSCDRCHDIHTAQLSGKTSEACKCSCHTDFTAKPFHPLRNTKPWEIINHNEVLCKTDGFISHSKPIEGGAVYSDNGRGFQLK